MYGELVALKVNIASSQLGKTPNGFGELIYSEQNPLKGLAIKEISQKADSALTFWKTAAWDYILLDSVVSKINRAFAGSIGASDTISFLSSSKLALNGKVVLSDVSFLEPSSLIAVQIAPNLAEGEVGVGDVKPIVFALMQNYPNPFNPTTSFGFSIAKSGLTTLKIYDVLGREVATLLNNAEVEQGEYNIPFDASSFTSGLYFYRLTINSVEGAQLFTDVKKMMLVK